MKALLTWFCNGYRAWKATLFLFFLLVSIFGEKRVILTFLKINGEILTSR